MFDFLHQFIASEKLIVFIVSALPVIELRGAIPLGVAIDLNPWMNYFICLMGSLLPVPFIFFLIRPIFNMLSKFRWLQTKIDDLINKTLHRSKNIKKYESLGLLLFVAIPLPGTGVWTGTLAAVLLDLRFKSAVIAITIGNIIAGLIVLSLSYGIGELIL